MIQEFLNYLNDYNLFEKISLCLGLISIGLFYLNFIVSIFGFILVKVGEYGFRHGCLIGAISLSISLYLLFFLQVLTVKFLNVILIDYQKNELINTIILKYYLTIPISIILIVIILFFGSRVWFSLYKNIFKQMFKNKDFKKSLEAAGKFHEYLSFNSNPKTIITNPFRGVLVHGGAGSGKSPLFTLY